MWATGQDSKPCPITLLNTFKMNCLLELYIQHPCLFLAIVLEWNDQMSTDFRPKIIQYLYILYTNCTYLLNVNVSMSVTIR